MLSTRSGDVAREVSDKSDSPKQQRVNPKVPDAQFEGHMVASMYPAALICSMSRRKDGPAVQFRLVR